MEALAKKILRVGIEALQIIICLLDRLDLLFRSSSVLLFHSIRGHGILILLHQFFVFLNHHISLFEDFLFLGVGFLCIDLQLSFLLLCFVVLVHHFDHIHE